MPSETARRSVPVGREFAAAYDDELLTRLLEIRHVELAILDAFSDGLVGGTAHTCLGQEHVPVALAPYLDGDIVFSNHRGHGHYLAMHRDVDGLLAEIFGRAGAVCGGVGGSQHILRPGRYMSTGVQGESVPVAVGVALHERNVRSGRLAVAFVGDGTWGQGVVYEALNMAALWSVPLVLVVENNGIAQSTPTSAHLAGTIAGRAAAFGIEHLLVETDDVVRVREQVDEPLTRARRTPAPLVLEFVTRRLGPHSKGDDSRPADELAGLRADDWAARYAERHRAQFDRVNSVTRARVGQVVAEVRARPASSWERGSGG